jgi:hypothetical protein
MIVEWLMFSLVTMEVRGSNLSYGMVEALKAYKWSTCLRRIMSGPHA